MEGEGANAESYAGAETRIELFSIGAGMLASALIVCFASFGAGASFALGAAISWLNFRWLKQGVGVLVGLSVTQEGAAKPRVPASVYVKFGGRYLLLLLAAYVILSRLRLPGAFLIAGLFVVVAAVLLELLLELFGVTPALKSTNIKRV